MGVIDTLTAGLTVVARHPWLILLPLLLDLLLWRGPALRPSAELVASIARPLQAQAASIPDTSGQQAVAFYATLDESLARINLWRAAVPPFFWPSVLTPEPTAKAITAANGELPGWKIGSLWQMAAIGLGLSLLALALNVGWLQTLSRAAAGAGTRELLPPLGAWLRVTARFLGLLLGALALAAAILLPLSFLLAIVSLVAPAVAQVGMGCFVLTTLWLSFWMWLNFYFTLAALVEGRQGILGAPVASLRLVRRYLWSALGFVLLCLLLSTAAQLLWSLMGGTAGGRLLSMVGNAALGTGLAAAMLIFFRDRMGALAAPPPSRA